MTGCGTDAPVRVAPGRDATAAHHPTPRAASPRRRPRHLRLVDADLAQGIVNLRTLPGVSPAT